MYEKNEEAGEGGAPNPRPGPTTPTPKGGDFETWRGPNERRSGLACECHHGACDERAAELLLLCSFPEGAFTIVSDLGPIA